MKDAIVCSWQILRLVLRCQSAAESADLSDWLHCIDWLIDYIDRLIDYIYWLIALIDWLIDWLIDYIDWLIALKTETTDETVSATLSQATCLRAVGDFVYVATTSGCLVVIDSTSLSVCATCQPYNPQITAILPLTTDQSQPADASCDQPAAKRRCSRLATVGRGYTDLVRRTVAQYNSSITSCDSSVLLVWSDAEWISHGHHDVAV